VVSAAVDIDGWVADGNYMWDLVWVMADTVVWLDFSRPVVMRRVIGRSLRRVLARQELWNENRERLGNLLSWNPEQSIIRWTWTQHAKYRERYRAAASELAETGVAPPNPQ